MHYLVCILITNVDYEVIDNFLPEAEFSVLQETLLSHTFPWFYTKFINKHQTAWRYGLEETKDVVSADDACYPVEFARGWFHHFSPGDMFYNLITSLIDKLDVDRLIRVKANMYPSSENIIEHGRHCDQPEKHYGALLSINTCNGYTILSDSTRLPSVANRCLIFDSSRPHSSTTCTDDRVRVNINVNYI